MHMFTWYWAKMTLLLLMGSDCAHFLLLSAAECVLVFFFYNIHIFKCWLVDRVN